LLNFLFHEYTVLIREYFLRHLPKKHPDPNLESDPDPDLLRKSDPDPVKNRRDMLHWWRHLFVAVYSNSIFYSSDVLNRGELIIYEQQILQSAHLCTVH
jgi:hypothetical protein